MVIDDPNIPVANRTINGPDTLTLGEGRHTLLFVARSDYDFDDDGSNDLYVEVARVS
jgi:hypothetical protein